MNRVGLAAVQYQALRDRLRAKDPELDEVTLADTLEGITDLHEILAEIVRAALTDEAMASGLRLRIGVMAERLDRFRIPSCQASRNCARGHGRERDQESHRS